MGDLTTLYLDENVRLDPERLNALFCQLGETGAENVICRAMEELAVRLAELNPLARSGKWAELAKLSRSLIAIAEQIGMTSLASVAADVTYCAQLDDHHALAATLARLQRIGDRSLTTIWDTQDLSV